MASDLITKATTDQVGRIAAQLVMSLAGPAVNSMIKDGADAHVLGILGGAASCITPGPNYDLNLTSGALLFATFQSRFLAVIMPAQPSTTQQVLLSKAIARLSSSHRHMHAHRQGCVSVACSERS
jgi:hypothetical protein